MTFEQIRALFQERRGKKAANDGDRGSRGLTQRDVATKMLRQRIEQAAEVNAYPPAPRRTGRLRGVLPMAVRRADAGVSSVYPLWVLGSMIVGFLGSAVALGLLEADAAVRLVVLSAVPYVTVIVGILRGGIVSRRRLRAQSASRYADEIAAMPEDGALAMQRTENLLGRTSRANLLLTQRLVQHAFLTTAIAVPVVGLAAYSTLQDAHTSVVVGACVFGALAIAGLLVSRQRVQDLEGDIRQADYERGLLLEHATDAERAEKLFLRQQFEVKRYYDETLRQSSVLSYLGVMCIAGGFAVIGVAFALVVSAPTQTTQQIIVAALGAAGGLLANFVAVVFLRMHAGTVKALTNFHERLVSTHHVHFGNLLASRVDPDSQHVVLGDMAVQLSQAAVPFLGNSGPREPFVPEGERDARGGARQKGG